MSDKQFGWYSTDAPGQRFNAEASDRSTLMAYSRRVIGNTITSC